MTDVGLTFVLFIFRSVALPRQSYHIFTYFPASPIRRGTLQRNEWVPLDPGVTLTLACVCITSHLVRIAALLKPEHVLKVTRSPKYWRAIVYTRFTQITLFVFHKVGGVWIFLV